MNNIEKECTIIGKCEVLSNSYVTVLSNRYGGENLLI
jgi:hypothetical protein